MLSSVEDGEDEGKVVDGRCGAASSRHGGRFGGRVPDRTPTDKCNAQISRALDNFSQEDTQI